MRPTLKVGTKKVGRLSFSYDIDKLSFKVDSNPIANKVYGIKTADIRSVIDNEGLKNTLNTIKNSADEAFFALSAGAGIMSVYEATRRDKVTKSHVDPLFKEALLKTREAAQTGMPYEQRQAALQDIANSYSGAMKNVMAISGGQRGAALANIGAVDSSRVNALVDLASKSADMRQKNLDLYLLDLNHQIILNLNF